MAGRRAALVGSLLALALAAALIRWVAVVGGHTDRGQVYSVATLRAYLAHDPRRWVGRALLVRGEVVPCVAMPAAEDGPCAALTPSGWQPPSPTPWRAAVDPLPVVHAGLDPFLGRLRRLPLLGGLLPAPQVLRWGAVGTYRVRLRASANSICGTGVCYEALLLDAAPDPPNDQQK
jgi:hypothetical protein